MDTLWKALEMPWEVLGTPWVDVWGGLGRSFWEDLPWKILLEDLPGTEKPEGS